MVLNVLASGLTGYLIARNFVRNRLRYVDAIHARWAPYYVRNVRVAAHSPVFKVLRDEGVPMDPENGQVPEDG